MTDRERARELIKTIHINRANLEYCGQNNIINGTLLSELERILLDFRNEGLREELIRFLKEYHKSMFVIDLENTEIDYEEIISEYLKTKE